MRYEAVIFDLFGTLVDGFSYREHERVVAEMASALALPLEEFAQLFTSGTWQARGTGRFGSIAANLEYIVRRLGQEVDAERIARAVTIRREFTRRALAAPSASVAVLATARAAGHRIGLISDCSAEVPDLWPETPFAPLVDAAIFSCRAGYLKPDPHIYALACDRLAARPKCCLYIGDRVDEVIGAARAGMEAVRVRAPQEDTYEAQSPMDAVWDGQEIATVHHVLSLL